MPGWDCHGLPIELKVLQGMKNDERKALTPLKLRERAAEFAKETMGKQRDSFRRYGVLGRLGEAVPHAPARVRGGADRRLRRDGPQGPHLPRAQAGALEPVEPHRVGRGRARVPRGPHEPLGVRGLQGEQAHAALADLAGADADVRVVRLDDDAVDAARQPRGRRQRRARLRGGGAPVAAVQADRGRGARRRADEAARPARGREPAGGGPRPQGRGHRRHDVRAPVRRGRAGDGRRRPPDE